MKVVVLAGGKGTRLGLNIPKAMVPVAGIPLLERIVSMAVRGGFTDFLFLTGHLSQMIERHFGDGRHLGGIIEYLAEPEPLGTAGCFRHVEERLKEPFIVIYGDILMDVDLGAFAEFALKKGGAGTLFTHPNDHPFDSDLLEAASDGRILAFHPKPHPPGCHYPNLVSAALYVLFPEALRFVPVEGACDWGRDVFADLCRALPLYSYRSCEYVKDIGTPDRLAQAQRHLLEGRLSRLALRTAKPAVFLDRDGVVNQDNGGVHSPLEVELIPGAANAIKAFNNAGIPVITVTNQPDIAKGKMTWDDLRAVTGEIDCQLASEAGAYIDDIFVCPHHPERGWAGEIPELKVPCRCRKPADGLLLKAAEVHHLDLNRSWLVGDRYCDIAAASSAGVHSILVSTGHAGCDRDRYSVQPDHHCADLASATEVILEALG